MLPPRGIPVMRRLRTALPALARVGQSHLRAAVLDRQVDVTQVEALERNLLTAVIRGKFHTFAAQQAPMTRMSRSKSLIRIGSCPITAQRVFPVPNHKTGAIALIVAMPLATTGAIANPGTATPEPTAIRLVLSTNQCKQHTVDRIIGLIPDPAEVVSLLLSLNRDPTSILV